MDLTKGYINPEQFKKYNEELEKLNIIQDAPEAIRAKKMPKPRAKKSAQSDAIVSPMDIETTPKLPKGKSKNNQKKKTKVVTL